MTASGCSEPLYVPEGTAWIGSFSVNAQGESHFGSCVDGPIWPTHSYSVVGFYLDEDEVTEECYSRCVGAGVCDPIDLTAPRLPATLTQTTAEQICAWRMGYVPSYVQLARAAQGAAETAAQPAMLKRWIDCSIRGFSGDACRAFRLRNPFPDGPKQPIRSYPDDVGPFGHHDLFGSQYEITETRAFDAEDVTDGRLAEICAVPANAPDPKSFGGGARMLYGPARQLEDPTTIFSPLPFGDESGPIVIPTQDIEPAPQFWGVRCAYPEPEQDQ